MAVNGLEILNAAKKQQQQGLNNTPNVSKQQVRESIINTSSSIEELASQYFGSDDELTEGLDYTLYPNGEKRSTYDPHEEMKELQNGTVFNNNTSKMPSAILESIKRNPLNMPTEGMQLEEEVMNTEIQNKSLEIINKLESNDRKNRNYVNTNNTQKIQNINESSDLYSKSLDNDYLVKKMEEVIDKKLKQYAGAIINESRKNTGNTPSMQFMKLGETFTFMDDANNIYECKMVYKGKGKIKKK